MIIAMKIIILTIALYALDVIIWGSILGFIYVLGYFSSNMFLGTDYSLTVSYFKGLVTYWVLDSILAKFREVYKVVIEDKIYKK
jgi:hypothetical protein